jgi:TonB family protein
MNASKPAAMVLLACLACAAQPAAPPHDQLPMVACDSLGDKTKFVAPQYPQAAKLAHVEGDVVLGAVIDKKGRIRHLHTISGHPLLVPAATDAVRQWQYKPYKLGKQKVEVKTVITVKFHM